MQTTPVSPPSRSHSALLTAQAPPRVCASASRARRTPFAPPVLTHCAKPARGSPTSPIGVIPPGDTLDRHRMVRGADAHELGEQHTFPNSIDGRSLSSRPRDPFRTSAAQGAGVGVDHSLDQLLERY